MRQNGEQFFSATVSKDLHNINYLVRKNYADIFKYFDIFCFIWKTDFDQQVIAKIITNCFGRERVKNNHNKYIPIHANSVI